MLTYVGKIVRQTTTMLNSKSMMIPSIEQRKSQINLLQSIEQERQSTKEFRFPDDNLLHRRRQSAYTTDYSATQSEDDDSSAFEVNWKFSFMFVFDLTLNK